MFIRVWCEYDINGSFGGNNDEEVLEVSAGLTEDQIEEKVLKFVSKASGVDEEDLEDCWGWDFIQPERLT
ncbi:hypothetical protein M316_0078 [Nitrincola phage 1M3-16]|uniref:hypothetical protein n=1 Tax=Nitrincola phage 1M3-16 TaxID=1472912 RepID=UPI000444AAB5|nr:hypothetical protein GJ22_gp074 [Nitrincola phage 1M3-16]AHX01143.1 hypothetical protein M316_0078 [Nitrincola phage 1M3-16]